MQKNRGNVFKMKALSGFSALFITLTLLSFPSLISAKVDGPCYICHTMHASQGGAKPASWDLTGDAYDSDIPRANLLVDDCVGCHSSDGAETIKQIGSTKIPIVYNTSGYPTQPLAGGNFYYVSKGGTCADGECDEYGHNVYGISGQDSILTEAPGRKNCSNNSNSCHFTLAVSNQDAYEYANKRQSGCQGCHFKVFHHKDNGIYRFLIGHDGNEDYYVTGQEEPNWEQSPSIASHNVYKGFDGPVSIDLDQTNSISSYCGGCHTKFHRESYISGSDPWLRHPTDIKLPQTGEYAAYDALTDYSNEAPVAYTDPANPTRATAVVMCLSCHRPHGSDQPDMLRWDYKSMVAGNGNSGGCFTCHTNKN